MTHRYDYDFGNFNENSNTFISPISEKLENPISLVENDLEELKNFIADKNKVKLYFKDKIDEAEKKTGSEFLYNFIKVVSSPAVLASGILIGLVPLVIMAIRDSKKKKKK